MAALESAPIKSKKGVAPLTFRVDVCAKCAVKIRYAKALGSRELNPVDVMNGDDEIMKYEDSKCHTKFVARYTDAQKFWVELPTFLH